MCMAELYRVEDLIYHDGGDRLRVVCSFTSDTRKEGTMVQAVEKRNGGCKINTAPTQPDLHYYPDEEQEYMKLATAITFRLAGGKV